MVATTAMSVAATALTLSASLGLGVRAIVGASFVLAGALKVAGALGIFAVATQPIASRTRQLACGVAGLAVLCAALADSHAVARIDLSTSLLAASAAHELGAAIWLGGLPCLWFALKREPDEAAAIAIGRRYSALAASGVALIVAGAAVFAIQYIGSVEAVYGTAYGAMAATKSALLAILLVLGFANFRALRTASAHARARVARFIEIEMGVGIAVLMAAASITSTSPSVDFINDRVTLPELAARMKPAVPRLASPSHEALAAGMSPMSGVRNDQDRAWSEYNHHWAGLLVVLMGLAGFAQRSGRARWASYWPLLFLLMAGFLLIRADPEVWPLGSRGVIESLRDPEVAQHRLFVAVIVAFALFEWRARNAPTRSRQVARVFPMATAIGGTLLLTHSHAVGDVKEQLLIEMTHLPIAVLGIVAGWARWLEVSAPEGEGKIAGWVWPSAFVLIGLLLLDYREA
jgi:putative copper resistance protein D